MKSQSSKKTVYVGMSGGVDSSVAAALLKKQGFNVVGVFMRPWQPWPGLCLWQADREDALRVASKLDIPLLTWDFSKEYKKEVGDYMIKEYRSGRTPNPDVACNKEIKFGLFLKKALSEGADFIATGHYVRIKGPNLYKAKDKNKDQSYFLWTLKEGQLKHCLFPIGDYTKPEVRIMAKKFGLSTYNKKDSQGVCFVGPLDMKKFLTRYIKNKKGKILDTEGNILGEHDGVFYYTIGQRHGLDLKDGQGPYYVIKKDLKRNLIYVGKEKNLGSSVTKLSEINWINKAVKLPSELEVKIRYRSKSEKATLLKDGTLKFLKSVRAITPGQSAVLYRGSQMIGGGIIN